MKIVDLHTGKIILERVKLANTFFSRFRGYMLEKKPPVGEGLLLEFKRPGRHSVHMFFMRFSLDLIFLDESFRVVEVKRNIKPWGLYRPKKRSRFLLELPAGSVRKLDLSVGRRLRKLY